MREVDWRDIDEKQLEAFTNRVALVETLLDESIDESDRILARQMYQELNGVSERTIRNYLKRYRKDGQYGLLFHRKRTDHSPRIRDAELRKKILDLIDQRPGRTVPQIRRLLTTDSEYRNRIQAVSDRTIYRFLQEQGLGWKERRAKRISPGRISYHRFQAEHSMELVQGDARDGIWLPKEPGSREVRKTYLFAWVDDYSRRILHAQYFWDEKLPRMEETFKTMVLRWGIPKKCYLDNGSVYIAAQFALILADLETKKIHHGPYQAWAKGKVEAVMKTIKLDFQSEAQIAGFTTLEELNSALWAWMDVAYNRKVHSSTGEPPADRFLKGLPDDHRRIENLAWFEALFLMRETRTVTKYGEVKLESNKYKTAARHGTVVEVRFNPFNLTKVWRFENGVSVEELQVAKLVNESSKRVIEEQPDNQIKTSREAASYFERLREQQSRIHSGESFIQFSKLKHPGDQKND
jgi:transposase